MDAEETNSMRVFPSELSVGYLRNSRGHNSPDAQAWSVGLLQAPWECRGQETAQDHRRLPRGDLPRFAKKTYIRNIRCFCQWVVEL